MKKRTFGRILSLFLALSMLLSVSPGAIAEADDDPSAAAAASSPVGTEERVMQLDLDTVPDIVGVDNAQTAGHVERLYDNETALNTVVFRNADGTRTAYYYDHPVKYIDDDGTVKDISLDIESSVKLPGAYISRDTRSQTVFSAKMTDGIILTDTDVSLRLVPVFGSPSAEITPVVPGVSQMGVSAAGSGTVSPTAELVDNTVVYEYDAKTSYEYTLTYSGFKEDIVVSEYTGQTEYTFTLYTNGLTLDTDSSGDFYLYDSDGNRKAGIGSIIIFTADWQNNSFGSMTAEAVIPNEQYTLTIHIDADYLADEKTKYPIRIDPEYTVYYGDDSLESIADITINTVDALSGTDGEISAGKWGSDGSVSRILMKFPALDLRSMHIIKKAEVFIHDLMCQHEYLTLECYPFTGNTWSPSNATWQSVTADGYDNDTLLDSHDISYFEGITLETSQRYGFDITDAVNGWRDGTYDKDKGIIFKAAASYEADPTHNYKTFASFDRSNYKPSLQITYENYETYYLQNVATGKMLYNEVSTGSVGLSTELNNQTKWQLIDNTDHYMVISMDPRAPGAVNAAREYPVIYPYGIALSSLDSNYLCVEPYDDVNDQYKWELNIDYVNGDLICTLENCDGYYLSASDDTTVSMSSTANDSSKWRMHPCSNPYSMEPGYTDKINNTQLAIYMNCYGYVMGLYRFPKTTLTVDTLQPGDAYGESIIYDVISDVNNAMFFGYESEYVTWNEEYNTGYITPENIDKIEQIIIQDVENDIKKLYGYSGGIQPTTYDAKMVGGWKKVALLLSTDLSINTTLDYHWYIEAESGRWYHKPGDEAVTNLEFNGRNIIEDPQYANRNNGDNVYDNFVGYFMIYSDSVLSEAELSSYAVSAENDCAGDCIEHARALSVIDSSLYVEGKIEYKEKLLLDDDYDEGPIIDACSVPRDVDYYEFMVEDDGTYIITSQYHPSITLDLFSTFYNGYEYVTYSDDNPDDVDVNFKLTVDLDANKLYILAVQTLSYHTGGGYAINFARQEGE